MYISYGVFTTVGLVVVGHFKMSMEVENELNADVRWLVYSQQLRSWSSSILIINCKLETIEMASLLLQYFKVVLLLSFAKHSIALLY